MLPNSIGEAANEYERNLNEIIDLLKLYRARLIFLTIPTLWQEEADPEIQDLLWFGWIGATGEYYTTSVLAKAAALYNQSLLKVCQDRKVEHIDLSSELPKNSEVFYDDVHLNVRGNATVAEIVSRYFSQSHGL